MTMTPTTLHMIGTALFAMALVHTFSTAYFERLAHASPRHAGAWHLLGEVEVVFGVWAMVLVLFMMALVRALASVIPAAGVIGFTFVALAFVPLLGSLITEPAAMTLAALILRERLYGAGISDRLKYATLGALFVNISIGGTLTPFAAPPVLMVAGKWGWDASFMLATF